MLDVAGILTTHLRTDATLMASADGHVYCDEVPTEVTEPFVLLRVMSATPAAPPSLAYDTYMVQADCVAATTTLAADLAGQTRNLIHQARGGAVDPRIASITVSTAYVGVDPTGSPAHPRWVLAVDVTGRSN